ncbi:SDR family NAD(P)-dependent oxidoreductase [Clostridium sp. B9]|uniref:SDR family NAD(P)-dependent oxidoreductase n=1 Tax=Clostridium sp. B9 TaxID=3423224 RepID=UPI003D2ECE33
MKKTAVITGATSGIGKEFAFRLASKGYNLIIVGRREDKLKEVAREIEENLKVNVAVNILDLTNDIEFNKFVSELELREDIEFLVNNAGYGADDAFTRDQYSKQLGMAKVHMLVTMRLCHSLSKQMKRNKKGYIINVSSMAGFNVFPSSAMYCSTKAFLISFSQCLAMELIGDNIKVQCLCPGFTRTDFHSKLEMEESKLQNKGLVRWMSTSEVVNISLKNIDKRLKVIVIPGFCNKILYFVSKLTPKWLYYKVAIKGWELMD